jgi:hypothetical protein
MTLFTVTKRCIPVSLNTVIWYLLTLARSQHCVLSEHSILIQRHKLNIYNLFNRSEIQSRSITLKYKMYLICSVNTRVVSWTQELYREHKICTVNKSCTVNTRDVPWTQELFREHKNCVMNTTVVPWTQQLYREHKSCTVNTRVAP